jgi:hypothetical protein
VRLVYEDKYGAYLGVRAEFLKRFLVREKNPNFEVYDSLDGNNRFIAAKSSRLPNDQDIEKGIYGIDFNRPKPELQGALQYGAELPKGYQWLSGAAFAAKTEQEYKRKSSTWDSFYSYIWGTTPQTIWVAPHSGSVNRPPDDVLRFPKLMIDSFTAGVAALCALKNKSKPSTRLMIAIHDTGHLGAVLNLGDFGILDEGKMDEVAQKMEPKYRQRAQILADAFIKDFSRKTLKILENILVKRGTLKPEVLVDVSLDDSVTVNYYLIGLRLYGQDVKELTVSGFKRAIQNVRGTPVPIISNNYFYTGRNVGRLLRLSEKIAHGMLGSALVIECSRLYAARDPEFVSDVILDVKDELFSH